MSTVHDPLEAAVATAESAGSIFGRLEIDGQFVILRKGQSKKVWVEGDSLDGRQTELTLRVNPLDCTKLTYLVERQMIANFGEWSNIVWPSLRELGVKALRDIHGKWVKVTMVKSGESYIAKNGAKAGQTIEKTTLKFLAIYNTEAEAIAAWEGQFGGSTQAHTSTTTDKPDPQPANDAEKAGAATFLPHIVKANKHDLAALTNALASMAPLNKYFTIDSPEVQALLKAA